jgi:hypothetical protein
MNRILVILIVLLVLPGCRKSSSNLIWERSFGNGKALFVMETPDSGIISCGELAGNPYLVKLNKHKTKESYFTYGESGFLSSVWGGYNRYIAAGISKGKMLLTGLDNETNLKWDTTLSATFNLDNSLVCYLGNGEFVGIASASPDSVISVVTGLFCVWFDTTGTISAKKELKESSFFSANKAVTDNSGNIYIAASRKTAGSEVRSTVIKYNSQMQKLWETELYNNPSFAASTYGIALDKTGNLFVSGKTKIATPKETIVSTVAASLTSNGVVRWKKYLEVDNEGSSVILDGSGQVFVLNKNCYVISILSPVDGFSNGIIRTFDVCDSKSTNSYANDFTFNYDGNIVAAGERNGGFYTVMKSSVFKLITP